ncbi:MAG: lysylphosphatidylglycerol synthase transmembrane domain-containing protein [Gemmatimonadales bacterium]
MSEPLSDPARRHRWTGAARLAASLALLWIVFRWVDASAVGARLASLDPAWVALGLAITVAQVLVLAWRWRYTASRLGIGLPLRVAVGEYYLGIFLNQVLPGGVAGDVSRAWRHARSDVPAGPAVRAVLLERLSAQAVMTLTAIVSVLTLRWLPVSVRVGAGTLGVMLVVAAAALLISRSARFGTVAGRLFSDAREALVRHGAFGPQLASAVVVVASYVLVFLIAARAVGVTTPASRLLPLVAPVLMTMLIPASVAGWGLREAAAAALWAGAGLTAEEGAAVSVAYGLLVLASSVPGLVVLMRSVLADRGRRARPPLA